MNDEICPHCGTKMVPVPDDWLLHHASYQGSPIHQALRVQSYLNNPEAADAAHQARMMPYRRRIAALERSEALEAARRQGLLAPRPRVQW